MKAKIKKHINKRPDHTWRKFISNTIAAQIHLATALVATLGLVVLLQKAQLRDGQEHLISCMIYGLSGLLVFVASSVVHFLDDGFHISRKLAQKLENIDMVAIYLFIAGTYTPILMHTISPPHREILLVLVWGLALAGVSYTLFKEKFPKWAQHRMISTGLYVLMGWIFVFRIKDIMQGLSAFQSRYLILGAASYSIGAVIFAFKRPNLIKDFFGYHELWHVLVSLGFAFHYFMIFNIYQS